MGTLAFMAKKLHAIEAEISGIKEKGIKKNIQLDFTVDGYEMIQKKSGLTDMSCEYVDDSVKQLLDSLTEREAEVLIHRYGLLGASIKNIKETAKQLSTTPERIRKRQLSALIKCRHRFRKPIVDKLSNKDLKKDILGYDE